MKRRRIQLASTFESSRDREAIPGTQGQTHSALLWVPALRFALAGMTYRFAFFAFGFFATAFFTTTFFTAFSGVSVSAMRQRCQAAALR